MATTRLLDFRKGGPKVVNAQPVRLVVVEGGTSRLDTRVAPDGERETVVVAQWSGESPASLVARITARVVALERSGKKVTHAILLVGERRDDHTVAARKTIARALFAHLVSSGGAELVLDALGAPVDVRHELLSEVEELLEEFERPSASVRLQFRRDREPVRPSGIYPVPGAARGARVMPAR